LPRNLSIATSLTASQKLIVMAHLSYAITISFYSVMTIIFEKIIVFNL